MRARISCSNSANPSGWLGRRQLLQVWRSVRVDAQLGVGRKAGVDLGGERRQFAFSAAAKSSPRSGIPSAAQ